MMTIKLDLQFFAQKKGGGSASTNCSHDSHSKRLGVKKFGGEKVKAGNIILRQRGTSFGVRGNGTYFGKDYTVHARFDGFVKFHKGKAGKIFVEVIKIQGQY